MKVLNLYAGIGGNRKLWENVDVTAVENNPEIAKIYQEFFPKDKVIIGDAHQYLLEHFKEYDFIWSSPPCQSHSVCNHFLKGQGIFRFPDMKLYEEIIFLKHFYKGKWVVENVIPYYESLIKPTKVLHRHNFWSNFNITNKEFEGCNVGKATKEVLAAYHGFDLPNCINQRLALRNCVKPELGKHIFDCAFKIEQNTLFCEEDK